MGKLCSYQTMHELVSSTTDEQNRSRKIGNEWEVQTNSISGSLIAGAHPNMLFCSAFRNRQKLLLHWKPMNQQVAVALGTY